MNLNYLLSLVWTHSECSEEYAQNLPLVLSFRALDDIRESIKELQYYRANIFKVSTEEKKRKIVENGNQC